MIGFTHVYKSFGAQPVLEDITFTVPQGHTLVITGPSGCGKTTLLRCINGLERVDSGELTVNGISLFPNLSKAVDWQAFRSQVGMVFQHYHLFPHMTVSQNIMLGPTRILGHSKSQAQAQADALLAQMQLTHRSTAYPHTLSGGEKQRVALARALAMHPKILLLDEPTSALDPQMKRDIYQAIRHCVGAGLTAVIVSHDSTFIQSIADSVLVMSQGRILDHAPWDHLQASHRQALVAY